MICTGYRVVFCAEWVPRAGVLAMCVNCTLTLKWNNVSLNLCCWLFHHLLRMLNHFFLFVVIKEPFANICSIYLDNYFPNLNPEVYNMFTSVWQKDPQKHAMWLCFQLLLHFYDLVSSSAKFWFQNGHGLKLQPVLVLPWSLLFGNPCIWELCSIWEIETILQKNRWARSRWSAGNYCLQQIGVCKRFL